jgi:hypothetical protein
MVRSPSQFGRYERDEKLAMHAVFDWTVTAIYLSGNYLMRGDLRARFD